METVSSSTPPVRLSTGSVLPDGGVVGDQCFNQRPEEQYVQRVSATRSQSGVWAHQGRRRRWAGTGMLAISLISVMGDPAARRLLAATAETQRCCTKGPSRRRPRSECRWPLYEYHCACMPSIWAYRPPLFISSAWVPSSTIRPASSTRMRSASRAEPSRCEMSNTVFPCETSRN
jgi:hypothetical protein